MSSIAKTLILDTPKDWETWLFIVKTMAEGADVWEFINPELDTVPEVPPRPIIPTAQDIKNTATSLVDLTIEDRELFKLMLANYKEVQQINRRIRDSLIKILDHITTSISKDNVYIIRSCSTARDMLVELKRRLAPTNHAQKLEIIDKYQRLKMFTKNQDIEKWLRAWETTYEEAKKLNLPEVSEVRSQFDFTRAIQAIDSTYASTQEYILNEKVHDSEKIPTLQDLIERFRNHHRSATQLAKTSKSFATFATLRGEGQDGEPKCLCGQTHRYKACNYITPSTRPQGWKGKAEIFDIINKAKPKTLEWFKTAFKYDGIDKGTTSSTTDGTTTGTTLVVAATTLSSFTTSLNGEFKLYNSWMIDNAADAHVCNDSRRSNFQKTRDADPGDIIYAGKTAYPVEAYGTVEVNIQYPQKGHIRLMNVALAPGFMTNLVSILLLSQKQVYWNSEFPETLQHKNKTLCNLDFIDRHWVIEQTPRLGSFATSHHKSTTPRHATVTGAQLHQILGHASPEVIKHVHSNDITVDHNTPAPSTIECETCSLTKATAQVSRRTDVEFEANNTPFDRSSWDMIPMGLGFNGDQWISHIECRQYGYCIVSTHARKNDCFTELEKAITFIETHLGGRVRFLRLDGETALGGAFEAYVASKGIKTERTSPNTAAQNGGSERSGRVIITKSRSMRIDARLPSNMWPEIVKTAAYIMIRTPLKKLNWKTPYEAVHKHVPLYSHMQVYGCRAYPLIHDILRKEKLDSRAHIGYLLGYDSTNVYRIWIPSRKKVIRTRDVTFKWTQFYDPKELDIGSILKEHADDLIETLELPEYRIQDASEEDDVLDSITVEVPATPSATQIQESEDLTTEKESTPVAQLSLPTPSPSPSPTNICSSHTATLHLQTTFLHDIVTTVSVSLFLEE